MIKLDIVKNRFWFYGFSLALTIFGAYAPIFLTPHFGIDLAGGSFLQIKTDLKSIDSTVAKFSREYTIFPTNQGFLVQARQMDEEGLVANLRQQDRNLNVLQYNQISSSLSGELRQKSILYILMVLLGIGAYISISFWKSHQRVSGLTLGAVVVLTLFHDVLAAFGIFLILAKFFGYYLDLTIITALLVVAGFSVHDTIVVFDRLRENLKKSTSFDKNVFNQSIQETLVRSVNTSFATVISIIPLVFLLPSLQGFLLTLVFGITVGTYSSIFVATPLVYDLTKK